MTSIKIRLQFLLLAIAMFSLFGSSCREMVENSNQGSTFTLSITAPPKVRAGVAFNATITINNLVGKSNLSFSTNDQSPLVKLPDLLVIDAVASSDQVDKTFEVAFTLGTVTSETQAITITVTDSISGLNDSIPVIVEAGTSVENETNGGNTTKRFTLLYSFDKGPKRTVVEGLLLGTNGRLYGMASSIGVKDNGEIFSVATDGSAYSVLHSFVGKTDGIFPDGSLILDTKGKLYGMTSGGGKDGAGTIFSVATDGSAYSVLHSFGEKTDGVYPKGGLILGTDGKLYGMTSSGGKDDTGTIFSVATDGSAYSVLYSFSSTSGWSPVSLVLGAEGKLYGMVSYGGEHGSGAIFSVATDGSAYSVLHSFIGTSDGPPLPGSVIFGTDSKILYGVKPDYNNGGGIFSFRLLQ